MLIITLLDGNLALTLTDADYFMEALKSQFVAPLCRPFVSHANLKLHK